MGFWLFRFWLLLTACGPVPGFEKVTICPEAAPAEVLLPLAEKSKGARKSFTCELPKIGLFKAGKLGSPSPKFMCMPFIGAGGVKPAGNLGQLQLGI